MSTVRLSRPNTESTAIYSEELVLIGNQDWAEKLPAKAWATRALELLKDVPLLAYSEELPLIRRYWRKVFGKVTAIVKDEHAPLTQRTHALWLLADLKPHEYGEAIIRGRNDEAILPQLLRALAHHADLIRVDVPVLGGFLLDHDPRVRLSATLLLLKARDVREMGTLVRAFTDQDPWVGFAAQQTFASLLAGGRLGKTAIKEWAWQTDKQVGPSFWRILSGNAQPAIAAALVSLSRDLKTSEMRVPAIAAIARIAYQPKPWDGHWWGTQPVKNPPPLPSVAWAGTPAALQALTAALSDPDAGVRLAAAKAFASFVMPKVEKAGP